MSGHRGHEENTLKSTSWFYSIAPSQGVMLPLQGLTELTPQHSAEDLVIL